MDNKRVLQLWADKDLVINVDLMSELPIPDPPLLNERHFPTSSGRKEKEKYRHQANIRRLRTIAAWHLWQESICFIDEEAIKKTNDLLKYGQIALDNQSLQMNITEKLLSHVDIQSFGISLWEFCLIISVQ